LFLLVVAFIAGFVTVVSPCVLPILPIVLATGAGDDRRRPYLVIAGLIAGFSFFTLTSVQIVKALELPASTLRDVAIVVIAAFGLTLLVPALMARYERLIWRLPEAGSKVAHSGVAGIAGGLTTGLGLGLVWTPCAGPILGAVTTLAVTAPGSEAVIGLVIAYSLGAGLPLLWIAQGGRAVLTRFHLRGASSWASRALGGLVLVTAGLMALGLDTALSADLTAALPNWTGTLQTLERDPAVRSALSQLGLGSVDNSAVGSDLTVGPAAPDFTGIDHWLNSEPLTMAGLRGKVVLVDFWTYSCINCIRALPHVEGWYQKYSADGFVVVGVHSPEFVFEQETANVAAAIARFGITYPVAQDNDFATWRAYGNSYWPADYLIDAQGRLRSVHFGEGDYDEVEAQIRTLLDEAGAAALPTPGPSAAPPPIALGQTPETYLGTDRATSFVYGTPAGGYGGPPVGLHQDTFPSELPDDTFAVSGTFDFEPEYIASTQAGDQLELSFQARDVYLILAADSPGPATVRVAGVGEVGATEDVAADGSFTIDGARLYHLVHLPASARGTLTITFGAPYERAYALTFGS
jgi:cytochrome c biogenesis protein CcdA/thiol-disulfide isomerase/thioredoxin